MLALILKNLSLEVSNEREISSLKMDKGISVGRPIQPAGCNG